MRALSVSAANLDGGLIRVRCAYICVVVTYGVYSCGYLTIYNYCSFMHISFVLRTAQPELQLFGVEGRYAHGLFSAASKKDVLAKVEKEIGTIKVLYLFCA